MPQNQGQPTIFFFKKCPVPSQEYGHCYIRVRFCMCYILTLCFFCIVCLLLYLSVNLHHYKTCHGTFLSQIHVFSFDVIFFILIGFCLMLSSFLCVLHFNVVSSFSLIFNAIPSVLVCDPDLFCFFLSIYEFSPSVYYCCLYLTNFVSFD